MLQFKTNIKCAVCVGKVTTALNETAGEGNWSVNLTDPDRMLTVEADTTVDAVITALSATGYKAEIVEG